MTFEIGQAVMAMVEESGGSGTQSFQYLSKMPVDRSCPNLEVEGNDMQLRA